MEEEVVLLSPVSLRLYFPKKYICCTIHINKSKNPFVSVCMLVNDFLEGGFIKIVLNENFAVKFSHILRHYHHIYSRRRLFEGSSPTLKTSLNKKAK